MHLSEKPASNYLIANINNNRQCYLIGPVDVYVVTNPYSKYVYRNT